MEGVDALAPPTSFSLPSVLDLLPSASASASFGRLGEACHRRVGGEGGATPAFVLWDAAAHLCGFCFPFGSRSLVLLVDDQGSFVLVAAALSGGLLRAGRLPGRLGGVVLL